MLSESLYRLLELICQVFHLSNSLQTLLSVVTTSSHNPLYVYTSQVVLNAHAVPAWYVTGAFT